MIENYNNCEMLRKMFLNIASTRDDLNLISSFIRIDYNSEEEKEYLKKNIVYVKNLCEKAIKELEK